MGMNEFIADCFDVVVIGAGHAGCEAALAAARLGCETLLAALSMDNIAVMPCNPSIGGTSKGHLVREVDALGGEMGKIIDKTYIQSRMLNRGKGPAVHSLRAQADKRRYSAEMRRSLEREPLLTLLQSEIVDVRPESGFLAVVSEGGAVYRAKAVVICGGTYFNARCLYGETIIRSGPNGCRPSARLADALAALGVKTRRFKTGTPARVDGRGVDFSKMTIQRGDEIVVPFSFENTPESVRRGQIPCWLTYTNERTHAVIRAALSRSPMYSGVIEGVGPRYCPSIEDKVVRFADRASHQVFIEPEGEDTAEMYVGAMSSSLPEDVQREMYRTVPGLERARITRNAYAIEYDCFDPTQLTSALEFRDVPGLFSAGQVNGSSGYEEAAAQGIIAGINAAARALGRPPLTLDRSEAYIGVLIDDLTVKGTAEPYRMMTSRAEYRLLLRQDNADLRLTEKGYRAGLIPRDRYERFLRKKRIIEEEIARVTRTIVPPGSAVNAALVSLGSPPLATGASLADLLRRPELSYAALAGICPAPSLPADVREQVEISVRYAGYIARQAIQAERFRSLERKSIPPDVDYEAVGAMRLEARQKLSAFRPVSLGQAARIPGVNPADINALMMYLKGR
ncbi:MAG: tRNA uridine-5-carboxymethylaminomethyl(34) synthesis enzyme MnmG [Clostridiales bacterium]|jgi:tRNA uridine 5-carboxymethylaminomethyl modification enzyme|nr:tRNA uridine-5-carboxymethylaminomethyl(34) synthesis enzyme MnmG [Clostridiales bacterium]